MVKKVLSYGLALLLTVSLCGSNVSAEDTENVLVERIRGALAGNDPGLALSEAQDAVRQYPNSAQLYQMLGSAQFRNGSKEDARAAFQRAVDLAPQDSINYFNLGRVELSLDHYAEVVTSLNTFLRFEPQDAAAHVLLGRAYYNLNETLLGIEQFKAALALDQTLPLAHFHLGYAAELALGNRDAAIEEFHKEMSINPGFYDPYWMSGDIEFDRGNLQPAETFFRNGIKVKPRAFQAHYGLGRVLSRRGRFEEAETEFLLALDEAPKKHRNALRSRALIPANEEIRGGRATICPRS